MASSMQLSRFTCQRLFGTFQSLTRHQGINLCHTSNQEPPPVDPGAIFIQPRVQQLLHNITGFDEIKLHRTRKIPRRGTPEIKLLTDDQLKKVKEDVIELSQTKLQLPPIMLPRKPVDAVLSRDTEIAGLEDAKHFFVDISYGIPERKRHMVVRERDGTLRKASWEERDRVMEVYYHRKGRKMTTPKMFESPQFEKLLEEGKYEYVLNQACAQFEPDSPVYIEVLKKTYDCIDERKQYDRLRTTRHFGGLAFHLVVERRIENLMVDMIQRNLIENVLDLMTLHQVVFPDCRSSQEHHNVSFMDKIKKFAELECREKDIIELALQTFEDSLQSEVRIQKQSTV